MFLLQLSFFFNNDLNFENDLYIINYVVIVIIIMNKISLRRNVENNNNQFYFANGLTEIISTFLLNNCYYFLIK